MINSPSNLELLLHCYYSPYPHPRLDAPAIREGIEYLRCNKMIYLTDEKDVYSITDKGQAYIDYLMKVPFPEQHWIVPLPKAKDP